MFKKNVDLILKQISPTDRVLDIGGWVQPFNRANYVIDIMPYETRGFFGSLGPEKESFSKESWIIQDVSGSAPLPFQDKEIDFVFCSHLLEDIRDPIRLCSEIVRIGKRGYIEVPSRVAESIMGLEGRSYTGYGNHRWLVQIQGSEIIFQHRTPILYNSAQFYLPRKYLQRLKEEDKVSFLFWEGSFEYKEIIHIGYHNIAQELERFARSKIALPFPVILMQNLKKIGKAIKDRIWARSVDRTDDFWKDLPDIESR